MKRLTHNVLWPAIAGNVLWSLLQVAVGDGKDRDLSILVPRLLALFFIGAYLCRDWLDTDQALNSTGAGSINDNYWLADLPMGGAIAVFAIAIQVPLPWSWVPLAVAFAVAAVGHLYGAWDETPGRSRTKGRRAFAGINGAGVVVAVWGGLADDTQYWTQAAAAGMVTGVFLLFRAWIVKNWWRSVEQPRFAPPPGPTSPAQ